ncbi:hypothetical protein EJB05_07380, partial [Eragrostis curvula]
MSEMNMCWVDGMLGVDGPAGAPVVVPAGAPPPAALVVPAGAPPAAGYKPPMRWTAVNSGFVLRRICDLVGGEAAAVMKGDGGDKAEAGEASKTPELAVGAKRKRTAMSEEEALLVTNMTGAINNVAAALRETGPAYVDDDLYDAVMGAAGFTEEALMVVYSHLLDNKAQGRGYIKMNDPHRVLWLRTWLGKHYYN